MLLCRLNYTVSHVSVIQSCAFRLLITPIDTCMHNGGAIKYAEVNKFQVLAKLMK